MEDAEDAEVISKEKEVCLETAEIDAEAVEENIEIKEVVPETTSIPLFLTEVVSDPVERKKTGWPSYGCKE